MSGYEVLPRDFFDRPTLIVARDVLGARLVLLEDHNQRLEGYIVECEAYIGTEDQGCHARAGRTPRNKTMWGTAGHAYVYFTYGMHWMLNLVTEEDGFPAAILVRGLLPTRGIEIMRHRRRHKPDQVLTDGPAKLCQALGIQSSYDGMDLCHPAAKLFLAEGIAIPDDHVMTGPRVGLDNVPEPWKSVPWRFRVDPKYIKRKLNDRRAKDETIRR